MHSRDVGPDNVAPDVHVLWVHDFNVLHVKPSKRAPMLTDDSLFSPAPLCFAYGWVMTGIHLAVRAACMRRPGYDLCQSLILSICCEDIAHNTVSFCTSLAPFTKITCTSKAPEEWATAVLSIDTSIQQE